MSKGFICGTGRAPHMPPEEKALRVTVATVRDRYLNGKQPSTPTHIALEALMVELTARANGEQNAPLPSPQRSETEEQFLRLLDAVRDYLHPLDDGVGLDDRLEALEDVYDDASAYAATEHVTGEEGD